MIVASVAFIGIIKSNRTNLQAIASADAREREKWRTDSDREREKWHRDNLLRLCSEALHVARDVQLHYISAAAACTTTSDMDEAERLFREHMSAAEAAIDKIVPLHYEISLLGESKVAFEFLEFREAAVFVSPAMKQFHRYLVANSPIANLTADKLQKSLEWRRYFKATTHVHTAIHEFHSVAQAKISPDSVPKGGPAKLEPLITPDKHPDLFYAGGARTNSPYRRESPFNWNAGDTADDQP
ncbi:Uncharacterised protein [Mycobacteroides abscessus subsp. bolletii]|uniref:hypothetical protein n=1 Tax=Mycobacteroides abscessus TaxID=36809 RepID=UPI00092B4255|nr:hypothetical protein [Mycobacteroides abscessus]SIJ55387.1 Uncharacterised protein [Mycobacteroides abscessus subsp. bolletii]